MRSIDVGDCSLMKISSPCWQDNPSWFRMFPEKRKSWGSWHVFSAQPHHSGVIETELNETQRFHQCMHWISSSKQKRKGKWLGKRKQEKEETWRNLGSPWVRMQSRLTMSPCLGSDTCQVKKSWQTRFSFPLALFFKPHFYCFVLICIVSGSKMFGV